MKSKNREPSRKDENGYNPGGHHLTHRLAQARRPALSADAMSRHDTQLIKRYPFAATVGLPSTKEPV